MGELGQQVDAVEQRTAQLPPVTCKVGFGAATALGAACIAARAWVRGGDQHEPGRIYRRVIRACDRDATLLERLAQRLQRRPRELRELVQEQHAVVGQDRLAQRPALRATHEPSCGDRVVRSAKRPPADEPACDVACEAVYASHLDGLRAAQRRQDRLKSLGQHCLASARRAAQQAVVAACGRDHERSHGVVLTADVTQVRTAGELVFMRARHGRPSAGGAGPRHRLCRAAAQHARGGTKGGHGGN